MRNSTNNNSGHEHETWLRSVLGVMFSAAVTTIVLTSAAGAQQATNGLPDFSGNYRCEGDKIACDWSGHTFLVTQSGSRLSIKNEKGEIGDADITSSISLSAGPIWNMLGVVVSPDSHIIQWSNGTTWRKTPVS